MDDALVGVTHRVQFDTELVTVPPQRLDLQPGDPVLDLEEVSGVDAEGGDVVVLGAKGQVGTTYGPPGLTQTVEGLGAGDLVDKVEVDVDQVRLAGSALCHDMVVPHFLGEGAGAVRSRGAPVLLSHSVHGCSPHQ